MVSKAPLTFGFIFVVIIFIMLLPVTAKLNEIPVVNAKSNSSSSNTSSHISNTSHKDNQFRNRLHRQPSSPLSKEPLFDSQTQLPKSKTSTSDNSPEVVPSVPSNFNKVVILTFGDGYQSQYTIAKPILDKYGYKGNFFVTCNKVGTSNKMTWPELSQLYQEGNVIGSKTVDYGTKAMEGKDLNHLSLSQLEFEVGQSKQCLLNHGINTNYFAVPMNLANDNATVINTIAKYYTLAINGHSNLMYLHCNGDVKDTSQTTDCRTYFNNGDLNPQNRYSIGEWSEQHIKDGNSFNDQQMFAKFIAAVNSQNKFNTNGVNAIPLIAYHDIVLLPDITLSNEPSATTLNLFNAEMKYLHDNGFKVLTFDNLGYDIKNNIFYLKV
jgi:peptidoglycan/xylan/chitin deacetylase (PgdA/CDA1 family)